MWNVTRVTVETVVGLVYSAEKRDEVGSIVGGYENWSEQRIANNFQSGSDFFVNLYVYMTPEVVVHALCANYSVATTVGGRVGRPNNPGATVPLLRRRRPAAAGAGQLTHAGPFGGLGFTAGAGAALTGFFLGRPGMGRARL